MSVGAIASEMFTQRWNTWSTPGALAQHLDPRTVQTPALDLIDRFLVDLIRTPDGRGALSMPPQEGKSQRVSRWTPLWALLRNPNLRIGLVSYEHSVARRWGRAVRDEIANHPELGLTVRQDLSAQHEWGLQGADGGMFTAGIGGALTGRPLDLLIIDDPVKDREQADSKAYRDRAWDWWTDVGQTRLSPGAPVIIVQTRWHEADLMGKLIEDNPTLWRRLNIPAEADHDPAKGETDPLGREPGEFMESARRRSTEQWVAKKLSVGSRGWASLYQGRPSPQAGDLFHRDRWARYDRPLWITRDDGSRIVPGPVDEMCQSWDFTFKDTKGSDWVVGQVWLREGPNVYLLDQVRGRLTFNGSMQAMRDLTARWPQAVLKLVEDKANGPAILNALKSTIGGMVPVEPEGSKYARAVAITPFTEARNVILPASEIAPWVSELIEEAAHFPNGAHDDQVDAMSQAVHRLLLVPILQERTGDAVEDELGEDADLGWVRNY